MSILRIANSAFDPADSVARKRACACPYEVPFGRNRGEHVCEIARARIDATAGAGEPQTPIWPGEISAADTREAGPWVLRLELADGNAGCFGVL